jgi:hypothetical protein
VRHKLGVLSSLLNCVASERPERCALSTSSLSAVLTIKTGLLTTVVALSDLILFIRLGSPSHSERTRPRPLIYCLQNSCTAVSFVLPKLYSNTVLLSLNSRSALRSGDGSYALQSVPEHSSHAHTDISAQSRVRPLALVLKLSAHVPAARDALTVRFAHSKRGARASLSLRGVCRLTRPSPPQLAIRVDTTRSEVTDEHKTADWAASRLGAQVIEDIDAEAMSKSASLGRGL